MGPKNAIIGDQNYGTDLPETAVPEVDLAREEKMAKFSKTKEFQALKTAMESRMDYWKDYAPGSQAPVLYRDLSNEERGVRTLVADILIEEFRSILGAYEQANQVIKEAAKKDA